MDGDAHPLPPREQRRRVFRERQALVQPAPVAPRLLPERPHAPQALAVAAEPVADVEDRRLDGPALLAAAGQEANKARLKAQCEEARERGIFGAPTFIAPDGELFWGNDRLERAVAWAAGPARAPSSDPA